MFPITGFSFCGFFVAKADADLFNNTSKVIVVRDGTQTVLTLSNDYKGDINEFAMVIPVPNLPKKSDIEVVDAQIFNQLDAYTSPRLAEYYDRDPCYKRRKYKATNKHMNHSFTTSSNARSHSSRPKTREESLGITIEAKYAVGEYDIIVLSAKQSDGLQIYLEEEGYKIPAKAQRVLAPYIKNNMKFFLAKVNLDKHAENASSHLKPLRITMNSTKFMLPIRLGMANAQNTQDMIIYGFTKNGVIETTNYKTKKMPTSLDVPLTIKKNYNSFYKAVFNKTYAQSDKQTVFQEYAWDVSPKTPVKCDPCVGPAPLVADLTKAGVWWANEPNAKIYITRLHARYDEKHFPQDLLFQIKPVTRVRDQVRFVVRNPYRGSCKCSKGQVYLQKLKNRRRREVRNLVELTGWSSKKYSSYIHEFEDKEEQLKGPFFKNQQTINKSSSSLLFYFFLGFIGVGLIGYKKFKVSK